MPVSVAVRNQEHFDLLGIRRCPSPEYESTVVEKPKPQRRGITFNEVVNVHFTLHVDDLNDDEYFNTWYQKHDFQMMRVAFAETVTKISKGAYTGDSDRHCARGLEYRTRAGAQKRKLNKLNALCAVLKEQDRQVDLGIEDDEELRRVYMEKSSQCKEEAWALGVADERETARLRAEDEEARLLEANGLELTRKRSKNRILRFLDRKTFRRRQDVLEDIRSLRKQK